MRISFIIAVLFVNICAAAENAMPSAIKPRVFVLTDVSNEPDDEKSLVRFLVYANEFDVEGIVATQGYFIVGGEGENQSSTSLSIHLAIDAGFTLAYFALYKNFRELIRRSNAGAGSMAEREKTFMHFKNLLADFEFYARPASVERYQWLIGRGY